MAGGSLIVSAAPRCWRRPTRAPSPSRARARRADRWRGWPHGGELRLDAALTAIPGIGPWTASYVAMRALGDPDVFLPGDVGIRNALTRLGRRAGPERWRPWRSYAVMHLWRSLEQLRYVPAPCARYRSWT